MRLNPYMKMSPCKDCDKHSDICHGICKDYKQYSAELNDLKTTVFKNKAKSKLYDNYKKKTIDREYCKGGKK